MKDKQFEQKLGNDIVNGISEILIMFIGMIIIGFPLMIAFYM